MLGPKLSDYNYVFLLNGRAISWKSFKQATISDSTIEAEYISAFKDAKKVIWIKKFITELSVVLSIAIYCEKSGSCAQAKELRSHKKNLNMH